LVKNAKNESLFYNLIIGFAMSRLFDSCDGWGDFCIHAHKHMKSNLISNFTLGRTRVYRPQEV